MRTSTLALTLLLITTPAFAQVEFPAEAIVSGPCLEGVMLHSGDPALMVFMDFDAVLCSVTVSTDFAYFADQAVAVVTWPWKLAPLATIANITGPDGVAGWQPGPGFNQATIYTGTGPFTTDLWFQIDFLHTPSGSGPFLIDNLADIAIQLTSLTDGAQPFTNLAAGLGGALEAPIEFHVAEKGINADISQKVAAATVAMACPPGTIACEDVQGNPFCSSDGVGCVSDLDCDGNGCIDAFDVWCFWDRFNNSVSFGQCASDMTTFMPTKQIP